MQVTLAKSQFHSGFPTIFTQGDVATHKRLMDRIYVPYHLDAEITASIFDLLATKYDEFVDREVNIRVASILLSEVLDGNRTGAVLDFGCGSGHAYTALSRLNEDGWSILGTDISNKMLRIAEAKGENVITINQWRDAEVYFDAAIACFVLHYGVDERDLRTIAKQLKNGGRFAANYFKAEKDEELRLIDQLAELGLVLQKSLDVGLSGCTRNIVYVFQKAQVC